MTAPIAGADSAPKIDTGRARGSRPGLYSSAANPAMATATMLRTTAPVEIVDFAFECKLSIDHFWSAIW